MLIKKLLLILLLTSVCQAAQIIRYVDPDSPGPAHDGTSWNDAYLTLDDWETTENTDLDTANNYMTVYCQSSSGTDDTANVTIDGWTTSATDYIEIIGFDFPADGIWDETKYLLHQNNVHNDHQLYIKEDYVRVINLQVKVTLTGANTGIGISCDAGAGDVRIEGCIVKGVVSSTGLSIGYFPFGAGEVTIYNSIATGFLSGGDTSHYGFRAHAGATNMYNCVAYGCYAGFYESGGTATCKNGISFNNTDDFLQMEAGDMTYCASDDGDGDWSQGPTGGNWANEVNNAAGDDFTLLATGNCVDNGLSDPGSGLYSDDIITTARGTFWDIGAYEYAGAAHSPAVVTVYVDPDAGGGGTGVDWANAYTALETALSTEADDISPGGSDEQFTFYCRASSGTNDTTFVDFIGWTTSRTNYIEIIGNDFPSDGIYDATKYVLENNDDSDEAINIQEDFVRVRNIQVLVTGTGGSKRGIGVESVGHSYILIDSCIVKGSYSGAGTGVGIRAGDTEATVNIYNCTVEGFVSGADSDFTGIACVSSTIANTYNSTIYDCYNGILSAAGTITATNCISGGCTDDFNPVGGSMTIDYCASDDGDGTNAQAPSGADWDNEMDDPDNGDFTIKTGGNCEDNGTDDPGSGLYSVDIIDTARASTWDIGAYEYTVPAPSAGGQVIMISGN